MNSKAFSALSDFCFINRFYSYPDVMLLLDILECHFEIQQKLGEYPGMWEFEDFLCTLKDKKWPRDDWHYWVNIYMFKGELDEYRKIMSLEEAINRVVEEYDL